MNTTEQADHLAKIANNTLFVLGAYFFAFFPWAVMSNIDFISEKWRSCFRTRRLAHIHIVSSVLPIVYVAVYAEAQRRVNDSKELGAALAALMFNVFQLMRTVMGTVQLNAFVAWCKHGVECMHALLGQDEQTYEDDIHVNDVWDKVMVNNTVVDNELGGRDVTVLPSFRKIWNGMKKGRFAPSSWLTADRAILCTVRWSGAFLCGLGKHWGIDKFGLGDGAELLKLFFSNELSSMRRCLQSVTWSIGGEGDDCNLFSLQGLGEDGMVDFKEEMSSAFQTNVREYYTRNISTVESYSFEFDSLVSSYPIRNEGRSGENRESVAVGLVHSLVLAKHLGVAKLKAIRRYYERYRLPKGAIRRRAFELLFKQMKSRMLPTAKVWEMLDSLYYHIPLFPYRMQSVALWDESTNWRVLQASAHHDVWKSLMFATWTANNSTPRNDVLTADVFDHCAKIAREENQGRIRKRGSLGVVLETVRTFLAKWLAAGPQYPNWEPRLPIDLFEFHLSDTVVSRTLNLPYGLIWACQHALQKEVARTWSKQENLPSNHALIMLFLLGFPVLHLEEVTGAARETQQIQGGRQEANLQPTTVHCTVDMSARVWRAWSILAPKAISLIIRVNFEARKVSLTLCANGEDVRFVWQDWIDMGMGCMKGFDENAEGESMYGRMIVRADLCEPMLELCPLQWGADGVARRTSTARIWLGWPPFDLVICKFEVEQLLTSLNNQSESMREIFFSSSAGNEVERAERLIEMVIQYHELMKSKRSACDAD